jgi:hypothetical protein
MPSKRFAEAVLLLKDENIEKQMLFQEFETVLDGGVALTEFRNQACRALYLQVNESLHITACVLFVIDVDDAGNIPANWHLPFTQLTENAGKGPNLGAGAIRLTFSGQCSVPWHNNKLWSPDDFPDVFILAQKAIADNRLQLSFENAEEEDSFQLPVLDMDIYSQEQIDDRDIDMPFEVQSRIETDNIQLDASPDLMAQKWHLKFKSFEKDTQQKIKQLNQNTHQEASRIREGYERRLLCVTEEYEKTVEEVTQQLTQVKVRLDVLSSQKKSLEEINQSQKQQIDLLQEKMELLRKQFEQKARQELQALTQKYEDLHASNLKETNDKWQKEVEKKDEEIMYRHELVKQLRKDICDLRRDKIRLVNSGADKFLENLEKLGINFIAFHPGAGHMSIPLVDMSLYMESPIGYAANRCLVTEEHYRLWLQHYENPICRFQISKEEVCGCRIKRVDVPKTFKGGASDRCVKHPSVSAEWNNVVKLSS